MNCESVLNVEDLYAEDRLTPSRKALVESHVKSCPSCDVRMKKTSPFASLKGAAAPKDLKERMKMMLSRIETAAPAPKLKPRPIDSELWPVLTSIAIYLVLALVLSWAVPGAPSQKYAAPGMEVSQ